MDTNLSENNQEIEGDDNYKKNISFAYEVMVGKFERLNKANNDIESKIGILLGFMGVIASGIIILVPKNDLSNIYLFLAGSFGIYVIILALIYASRARTFLDPPSFDSFYSESALNKKNIELKNKTIANIKASFEENMKIQKSKAKLYNFAIYCFAVSTLLLFSGTFGGSIVQNGTEVPDSPPGAPIEEGGAVSSSTPAQSSQPDNQPGTPLQPAQPDNPPGTPIEKGEPTSSIIPLQPAQPDNPPGTYLAGKKVVPSSTTILSSQPDVQPKSILKKR